MMTNEQIEALTDEQRCTRALAKLKPVKLLTPAERDALLAEYHAEVDAAYAAIRAEHGLGPLWPTVKRDHPPEWDVATTNHKDAET